MEKQEEIIVKREITVWFIIFHICMGIIIIWVILKSIGVIQTPFWLEYGLPMSTFVLGFLALYYDLIKSINKVAIGLAVLTTKFGHLEKDVGRIDQKTDRLEIDVSSIKRKIKLS